MCQDVGQTLGQRAFYLLSGPWVYTLYLTQSVPVLLMSGQVSSQQMAKDSCCLQ